MATGVLDLFFAVCCIIYLPNTHNAAPCSYLERCEEAKSSRLVLVMPQHALQTTIKDLNKDILIIDENIASCIRKNITISPHDIAYSRRLIKYIENEDIKHDISRSLDSIENKKIIISDIDLLFIDDKRRQFNHNVANAYHKLGNANGRWLLNDIKYLSDNRENCILHNGYYVYSKQSWIPKDRPVFVLDATQSVDGLRLLFPEHDIVAISSDLLPPQQCDVIQVIGATYGATTLFDARYKKLKPVGDKLIQWIKDHFGNNVDIISIKQFVEIANLKNDFSNVGWYGNTRGLNVFNDSEVLIILGFWMKPIDVIVTEAMEAHGMVDVDLGNKIQEAERDMEHVQYVEVTALDGTIYRARHFSFTDPYVDAYFHYAIQAELSQAVGRARIFIPHEPSKQVWIITDVLPTQVCPTRVKYIRDLVPDKRVLRSQLSIGEAMKIANNPQSPQAIYQTLQQQGVKISLKTVQRHYKNCS